MGRPTAGDLLMWAGVAAGAFGALLLGMGAWVNMPAALVIAIAKALPFVVAAALLALGAVVRRRTVRRQSAAAPPAELGDGAAPAPARRAAHRERA